MGFGSGFIVGFGLSGSFFFLLMLASQWRLDQAVTDLTEMAKEAKGLAGRSQDDRDDADWWKLGSADF